MKQSVLICEGSTDYVLLQYFMRKGLGWEDVNDKRKQQQCIKNPSQKSRLFEKDGNELTIMASGGCSRITEALDKVLTKDTLSPPDKSAVYDNVIIVTDRDEIGTEAVMLSTISRTITNKGFTINDSLICKQWISCTGATRTGNSITFKMLILVIPFEETGAMETFLLNAVKAKDPYDKKIVEECEAFIGRVDPNRRYLTKRRYITKAKFDAFFSVRTAAEQFVERQRVLLNVKWEDYPLVNNCFELLKNL